MSAQFGVAKASGGPKSIVYALCSCRSSFRFPSVPRISFVARWSASMVRFTTAASSVCAPARTLPESWTAMYASPSSSGVTCVRSLTTRAIPGRFRNAFTDVSVSSSRHIEYAT